MLALIIADEQIAGGAAEGHVIAAGIDIEPVPIDQVVGMFLRQAP
jgi:hypothetical protein